ncbi:protein D3 isoform X2 [Bemisia tabaci]|uniref:protein D3 isoform X2 n=1 Tax=Bemisia tabaci TaxID=7038 RepID=UPI003B27B4BA
MRSRARHSNVWISTTPDNPDAHILPVSCLIPVEAFPLELLRAPSGNAFYDQVTYGKNIVDFGNNLTDSDIRNEPTHVSWPAEKDSLYTLMLIGPDIPTHENPEDKECQHWIVANIPGDDLKIGHYLSEYVGILSFYERGTHRLLFLVFKQSSKNTPLKFEKKEYVAKKIVGYMRAFFVFKPFAAKYHLGEPVAANFFLVQTKPHQRNFSNIPAGLIARHKTAP